MKLINSNGNWLHQGNAWTITAEGSEGNIEDQTSGRVLGILNDAFDIGKVKNSTTRWQSTVFLLRESSIYDENS